MPWPEAAKRAVHGLSFVMSAVMVRCVQVQPLSVEVDTSAWMMPRLSGSVPACEPPQPWS